VVAGNRKGKRMSIGDEPLVRKMSETQWFYKTYEATKRVSKNTLKTTVDMLIIQILVLALQLGRKFCTCRTTRTRQCLRWVPADLS
jgi:hypothetical protein